MKISLPQQKLIHALTRGYLLKAHRDLEGHKVYQLHPLQGKPETVAAADVQHLCDAGLIDSNKKFPAATFWLTEKGRTALKEWGAEAHR